MIETPDFGAWSLLPTFVVLVLAIWSRRPIESLLGGALLGLVMVHGAQFLTGFADTTLRVMTDEDVAWVILVCGFMGSLIALFTRTGATRSFTRRMTRFARDAKSTLFTTWGIGIVLFVDDYLNSLALGSSMRELSDKFRIPREKLAYVVDSTAAPISVLIPISTWGAFFGGLLVDNGVAPEGRGLETYIRSIPYMLYAWAAVLLVPIVISGRIPDLGPMRAAEARVRGGGPTVPPEADHIEAANQRIKPKNEVERSALWFIVPMLALIVLTLWFDKDFLRGIYATLGLTVAAILVMKLLDMVETFDTVIDGFKTMIEPLGVLVAAFILKDINDALGLASYVVALIEPVLTPELLPVMIFVTMGAVSFATGSNWGVFVIILPIVTALANNLGADMTLTIGATLSASTFGSHACFYSDATVLTAQATGTTPMQHALTQIPYALLAAGVAALGYLALAYL